MHPRSQRLLGLRVAGGLRSPTELRGRRGGCGLRMQCRPRVPGCWNELRKPNDPRHVRDGRARLRLPSVILDLHELQRRRLLHELVRAGPNHMRRRQPRDLYPPRRRVLGLRRPYALRNPPDVHGTHRRRGMQLQRRSRLQDDRHDVRRYYDARHMLGGRAKMQLRVGDIAVRQRRMQWGRVLRQRMRGGSSPVLAYRRGGRSTVHPRSQRLLDLGPADARADGMLTDLRSPRDPTNSCAASSRRENRAPGRSDALLPD
jgi:hypothetical protein